MNYICYVHKQQRLRKSKFMANIAANGNPLMRLTDFIVHHCSTAHSN